MQLDPSAAVQILESIVRALQANLEQFLDWWSSLDPHYRAAGCLVASILLMLEATRITGRDRRFFFYGFLAVALLVYSALLFVGRARF